VAEFTELQLFLCAALGEYDNSVALEVLAGELFRGRQCDHGNVGVQLGQVRLAALGAVLTEVLLVEEELTAEVVVGDGAGVVDCDGLDASQDDVLGYFDADAAHATDEDVGGLHAAHGFVT